MQKVHYSIFIPAPREKVFQAVIGKDTYPQWTEEFCPGSGVEGEWKQGEKIRFTAPNPHGTTDGMASEIAELRPNEFISIRHMGIVKDGQIVTDGKEAEEWKNVYENYTLTEQEGGTLFEVDIDLEEQWIPFFNQTWESALKRLKEVVLNGESSSVVVYAWIKAPVEKVWHYYTTPELMTLWNFASDDWECPHATVDLRVGGSFSSRMQAKDGSMGFDFGAEYTKVEPMQALSYRMSDGRTVDVTFREEGEFVHVSVRFDTEKMNARELQKQGWQAILNNFKLCVEREVE